MAEGMAKVAGHSVTQTEKEAIYRLANMCEFGTLVKIFRLRYMEKNRLQGISGQPFADGKQVGTAEGVLGDVNFLLDISAEAAKNNNADK